MQHRQLYMLRPNADVTWPARFGADGWGGGGGGGEETVEEGGRGAFRQLGQIGSKVETNRQAFRLAGRQAGRNRGRLRERRQTLGHL